jgi:sirohydrochlorin ferrochelatase
VTDVSQPAASPPSESLPQRDEMLPQRGESLPQRGAPLPQRGDAPPDPGDGLPERSSELPQRGASAWSPAADGLPQRGESLPQRSAPLPQRGQAPPGPADGLPERSSQLPQRGTSAWSPAADGLPQRGAPLPQRGEQQGGGFDVLPRRTTRTRPSGRHRSPHRLSVASDAPALVLAVPGTAEADVAGIGPNVAAIAELSCPGVDIRLGYLAGDTFPLWHALDGQDAESGDHDQFPSVIVPLLLSPNPAFDGIMHRAAAEPPVPAVVAGHLGPHPLVAEALHTRLAEAGLARHARASGLSISADGRGIVVLADVGEEAASAAAVAAVLLASRLSVPVVPASLSDPASIVDAVSRLSESGAPRPVLAPCLIGPETSLPVLEELSAALNAPCAPVLGAHQAIGQLVAIRYGAALATLSLAG